MDTFYADYLEKQHLISEKEIYNRWVDFLITKQIELCTDKESMSSLRHKMLTRKWQILVSNDGVPFILNNCAITIIFAPLNPPERVEIDRKSCSTLFCLNSKYAICMLDDDRRYEQNQIHVLNSLNNEQTILVNDIIMQGSYKKIFTESSKEKDRLLNEIEVNPIYRKPFTGMKNEMPNYIKAQKRLLLYIQKEYILIKSNNIKDGENEYIWNCNF